MTYSEAHTTSIHQINAQNGTFLSTWNLSLLLTLYQTFPPFTECFYTNDRMKTLRHIRKRNGSFLMFLIPIHCTFCPKVKYTSNDHSTNFQHKLLIRTDQPVLAGTIKTSSGYSSTLLTRSQPTVTLASFNPLKWCHFSKQTHIQICHTTVLN